MPLFKTPRAYYVINIQKILIITLLYAINVTKVSAQLKAAFTANKTSGCTTPALIVNFTNTTQNASSTATYYWDFGNGNTSALQNPSTTFRDPKSYTVTLTVTDGGTSTATTTITVHNNPICDFSATPLTGCVPMSVTFTDKSNPVDGTIDNYVWDFGDGNTNVGPSYGTTTNVYNFNQQYTVGLTVTNSFGCESTPTVKTDLITANPQVFAAFQAQQATVCATSDPVIFTNSSSVSPGTLTYLWDFGDGTTSTDINPTHTYATKGTYSVKLTATSDSGCTSVKDSINYINVADFSSSITLPAAPICQGASLNFSGTASPTPINSFFYFSDNTYYNYGLNINGKIFYNAGTYTATLVSDFGGCNDTATSTFVVSPKPQLSGFEVIDSGLCGAPVTVNFKDTSSDAVSWSWNFDNSSTSTLPDPSYTFSSDGFYTISLITKNAAGCSSYLVDKYLQIAPPYVQIEYSNINSNSNYTITACVGVGFVFKAQPIGTVSKYSWNFGDGSTSTDSTPTHTYNKPGTYTVTLTYTTINGCTGTATLEGVEVYAKPIANFYTNDTIVCGNTPVLLVNTSTPSGLWSYYTFNDSLQTQSGYLSNNSYQFYYPGTYSVTLIVGNNGNGGGYCADTITKTDYIKVLPPFPKISNVSNTCDGNRGDVTFSQQTRMATQWIWNFGDNTPNDTLNTNQPTVLHTYTKSGDYKVVHTAVNGSCYVRDSVQTPVLLKQHPVLTLDKTVVCGSDTILVNATNYDSAFGYGYGYNVLNNVQYGDGTQFNGSIEPYSYSYGEEWYTNQYTNVIFSNLQDGENDLRLITQSSFPFYCYDTTNYATLKIKGPIVNYEVGGSECFKKPVSLIDTSAASNTVPIKTWQWNFGDGTTQQTTIDSAQHIYSDPGEYYTSLKVTDADGCSATTSSYSSFHEAVATGPKANFDWYPYNISPNSTATFNNTSNTYGSYSNEYLWHFSSDNSTSTNSNSVTQSYTNPIIDTVTLIAKSDVSTCIDTIVQYVPIKNSNISFTYTTKYNNDNNNTCPPMIAYFTSVTYNIQRVDWIFGNGKTAIANFNPSTTYDSAGIFTVTVIGYGYNGDVDTVYGFVTVKGPYAQISTNITQGCLPVTVILTAHKLTSDSLTWDFGDGIVQQGKDSIVTHTYKSSGAFNPAIIVSDTSGCQTTFQLPVNIISDTLGIAFVENPYILCLQNLTQFNITEESVAVSYIDSALSYHWSFGTGNNNDTSSIKNPSFLYTIPGSYPVSLYVKSVTGCEDSAYDSVIVKPIAPPSITGPNVICEDVPTQYLATITGNYDVTWFWQFNNGNTDTTQKPALQSFKASQSPDTIFVVSNLNGCPDTAFYPVTINAKPHINLLPKESDTLCLGNTMQLIAHDGITYQWYPITFISDTAAYNPIISPKENTTYSVTVTNNNGCTNIDSAVVTVAQPFKLSLPPEINVCINDSVQLEVSGAATYKWTTNTATLSDSLIGNPIAKPLSDVVYTVIGYDSYNCFTDTMSTQVYIRPLPTVSGGTDNVVLVGTSTTFSPLVSSDVVSYAWVPIDYLSCSTCLNPTVTPRLAIQYTFTGKTIYGCAASTKFGITLKCEGLTLTIPNAFTPGKTINNLFYPIGKGVRTVTHFAIYGRTGELLFDKKNFNINDASYGWDGTYNGQELPSGTYVYMIDGLCDTGDDLHDNGTVVLIR